MSPGGFPLRSRNHGSICMYSTSCCLSHVANCVTLDESPLAVDCDLGNDAVSEFKRLIQSSLSRRRLAKKNQSTVAVLICAV
jgi:hypothetical protein